jgi:hypothetical protein
MIYPLVLELAAVGALIRVPVTRDRADVRSLGQRLPRTVLPDGLSRSERPVHHRGGEVEERPRSPRLSQHHPSCIAARSPRLPVRTNVVSS